MSQPAPLTSSPPPPVAYATFAGGLDQASVQRIFNGFSIAINAGVQTVHLLMQSTGGLIGDGVALYNYFRAVPIDLHLYNSGCVASVAVIAFLGAKHRYASTNATFVIHKSFLNVSATTNAAQAPGMANSLKIDDAHTRAILRSHLSLSNRRLEKLLVDSLPFTAQYALGCNMITAIKDFVSPPGQKIFAL